MEIRSVCVQPLDAMLEPTAFYAGICEEIHEAAALVDEIYEKHFQGLEPTQVRSMLMKRSDRALRASLQNDCRRLLALSMKGLEKRGYGEEKYLKPLIDRLEDNGWRVPAECQWDDAFEQTKQQMKDIEKERGIDVD